MSVQYNLLVQQSAYDNWSSGTHKRNYQWKFATERIVIMEGFRVVHKCILSIQSKYEEIRMAIYWHRNPHMACDDADHRAAGAQYSATVAELFNKHLQYRVKTWSGEWI